MSAPLVFVTGFEPFLDVAVNPSGELAQGLTASPPAGIEVVGALLPVSFERTPAVFEAALAEVLPRRPVALLGLGVQRGEYFRLESTARAQLSSEKPDADGVFARDLGPLGDQDLHTALDLEALRRALLHAGAPDARTSQDAGGYLCERTYYSLLSAGQRCGLPALFLHVPPVEAWSVERQLPVVQALIAALVSQAVSA
jgi:pyroglutamyl-peptidase